MKPGQIVSYTSYGQTKTDVVRRVSRNGKILFFDRGRWMHRISCQPAKPQPQSQ